jgi:hypothetical protein
MLNAACVEPFLRLWSKGNTWDTWACEINFFYRRRRMRTITEDEDLLVLRSDILFPLLVSITLSR